MSKKRVYEFAKDLNVESKTILEKAESLGIEYGSHMSSMTDDEMSKVKSALQPKQEKPKSNEKKVNPSKKENTNNKKTSTKEIEMLFKTKPSLYLQLLESSIRYLAVHPTNYTIIEQDELLFDGAILEDGEIVNQALLETRLNALVLEKNWKNAKATILILNELVIVREIEVPIQLDEDEIPDYLNIHMNETIRMPFDNPSFEYIISGRDEDRGMIDLILIAYPKEKIRQYQDILQNVSLKPDVADVASLSIYRVADSQALIQKGVNQHTMILQWNPTDVSYTVFNQEKPIFKRNTDQGTIAQSFEQTADGEWRWIASEAELEIHIADQLTNLGRFLDFYRYSVLDGEVGVSNIILTGSYPHLEDLQKRIAETLNLKVELLDLPTGISQPYGALYGLTLRGNNKSKDEKKGRKK